jgi:multidrug efflux pump subunit AcrB
MQWLARISVHRAVFATVLMLAIVVIGLAGYGTLGVDFFPKIDQPLVTVITRFLVPPPRRSKLKSASGSRER